jgi:hypothetical protein
VALARAGRYREVVDALVPYWVSPGRQEALEQPDAVTAALADWVGI